MRNRILRSLKRLVLKGYKYVAIAAYLLMFGHVVLLLLGYSLDIAETYVFMTPVVTLFSVSLSWILGYCFVHRLCLMYTGVVSHFIRLQEYGVGLGEMLHPTRIIVMLIGLIIGILILAKKVRCSHEQD